MKALNQAIASLAAEFSANARVRWGIWLILGILLGYCLMVQSDRMAAVHDEYAAEAHRLANARILLDQQDWAERLEAERKTYRALEARFWQAETEGVAQAKLQVALTEAVGGLELHKPRIRSGVSQPDPELPGIWLVQTRLDATYPPGVELQLLHALATHPKKLIVDRLNLRQRARKDSYLTLILSAYFVGVSPQ